MRRELSLDTWRGLMLVIMAVVHLGGAPAALVGEMSGFASAAEGFVLLSGVMCGLVYGRYGNTDLAKMRVRCWQRAWTIYAYHFGTLSLLLALVVALSASSSDIAHYYLKTDLALFVDDPARGLTAVAGLVLQPTHFDILALYVVFMALAPIMLAAFARGHAATMFGASIALWLAAQFGLGAWIAAKIPVGAELRLGDFDLVAWQILFVTGGYVGWRRASGLSVIPAMPAATLYGAIAVVAVLFLIRHHVIAIDLAQYFNLEWAIARHQLGWLRLLNVLLIAFVVYGIAARFDLELRNAWLAFLGGHSLQVYAFHALVLYLAYPFRWRISALGQGADLAFDVLFVAGLTIPAIVHQHLRNTARRRAAAVEAASAIGRA
jgi:hypothetical protein